MESPMGGKSPSGTLTTALEKPLFWVRKLKWPLNIAIIVNILLVPIVFITGGFEVESLFINMNRITNPIWTAVILLFFRLLLFINFKDFLPLITSIGVALVLFELFLRIWSPAIVFYKTLPIHRESPVFGWELIPNASGRGHMMERIDINTDGNRDFPEAAAAGSKRVAVLGDSFTFGMGIELVDTYHKELENLLKAGGIPSRTYNFGVIGYDMWQIVEIARRKAIPLNPDLIIIGFFHNDMARNVPPFVQNPGWPGENPFALETKKPAFYLGEFLQNLNKILEKFYRDKRGEEYRESMAQRRREFGPENPDSMNYQILYGKASIELYEGFSKKMKELSDAAKGRGIPVLAVFIPDAAQINNPQAQHVNGFFRSECEKHGIHFIDITPIFESESDPRDMYMLPLDAHTSSLGHERIASAIHEYILKHKLL